MTRATLPLRARRVGTTLIELVVAMVIIGITAGLTMMAWSDSTQAANQPTSLGEAIAAARRVAIATGRTQRSALRLSADGLLLGDQLNVPGSAVHRFIAFPDGSIVAPRTLRVDRLAGRAVLDGGTDGR